MSKCDGCGREYERYPDRIYQWAVLNRLRQEGLSAEHEKEIEILIRAVEEEAIRIGEIKEYDRRKMWVQLRFPVDGEGDK